MLEIRPPLKIMIEIRHNNSRDGKKFPTVKAAGSYLRIMARDNKWTFDSFGNKLNTHIDQRSFIRYKKTEVWISSELFHIRLHIDSPGSGFLNFPGDDTRNDMNEDDLKIYDDILDGIIKHAGL